MCVRVNFSLHYTTAPRGFKYHQNQYNSFWLRIKIVTAWKYLSWHPYTKEHCRTLEKLYFLKKLCFCAKRRSRVRPTGLPEFFVKKIISGVTDISIPVNQSTVGFRQKLQHRWACSKLSEHHRHSVILNGNRQCRFMYISVLDWFSRFYGVTSHVTNIALWVRWVLFRPEARQQCLKVSSYRTTSRSYKTYVSLFKDLVVVNSLFSAKEMPKIFPEVWARLSQTSLSFIKEVNTQNNNNLQGSRC